MSKLEWDGIGQRFYETGTDRGVLYLQNTKGEYQTGVAWSGLTGVTESPSGADNTDLYADNVKYASMRATETFGATIEAYTYPDEFALCDGSAEIAPGVMVGQQNRNPFGFSYRTKVSNDLNVEEYKIHIIYGATVSPSDKSYASVNDSPDAITFSWEVTTTPVNVPDFKPTANIVIDTRKSTKEKIKALETILYGDESSEPRLPLPSEVMELMADDVEPETIG